MKKLTLIISLVVFVFSACGDGQTPAQKKDGDVHGAWAYMQLFVEKRLNSPKSADFPFGVYRHVTPLRSGRYKVQSYVDAKNAFGVEIRTNFEGIIKRIDGCWELEYLNFDE